MSSESYENNVCVWRFWMTVKWLSTMGVPVSTTSTFTERNSDGSSSVRV